MAALYKVFPRPLTLGTKYFSTLSRPLLCQTANQLVKPYAPKEAMSAETKALIEAELVDPLTHPDFFNVRSMVSMREMVEARVHLGHKAGTQNEFMRRYVFGNRLGVDVIDLEQTRELLGDALNIAAQVAFRKGIIMFVSRARQTLLYVEQAAYACGEYSHCRNFKPGDFTNSRQLHGMDMRLPDLAIFISTHNHALGINAAVTECAKMNIPSIGVLDTNCDPRLLTYPVPGNDDTPSAVRLYCRLFQEAIARAKRTREQYDARFAELEAREHEQAKTDSEAAVKNKSSHNNSTQPDSGR